MLRIPFLHQLLDILVGLRPGDVYRILRGAEYLGKTPIIGLAASRQIGLDNRPLVPDQLVLDNAIKLPQALNLLLSKSDSSSSDSPAGS